MNTKHNSCFYCFKKTVILSGEVIEKVLHLNKIDVLFNKDCETIATQLKQLNNLWIDEHTGLEACLSGFRFDIARPSADLIDIWLGLKSEKKIIKHFENNLSGDEEIIAIQILLKALTNDLFQPVYSDDYFKCRGTVVQHKYALPMNYGRTKIIYGRLPR